MVKSRDNEVLQVFSAQGALDETVESILSDETRRRDEMQLSPEERRKVIEQRHKETVRKEKAKRKTEQQKPNSIRLLLPVSLKKKIETIASWNNVTTSQVVTFLLFEAVDQYDRGVLSFSGHKFPSDSPRYEFTLIHPQDDERTNRRSARQKKNSWKG